MAKPEDTLAEEETMAEKPQETLAEDPEGTMAEKPEEMMPEGPSDAAARAAKTAVRALMLCALCRNFGIMIRMQTEMEIWMREYGGDYAGQAAAQGMLESVAGVLSFVIGPILAGVSDSIGRRPLMIMAPGFSVAVSALIAWRPTVQSLKIRRMLMAFSSTPWHSGEAAALADLFKHDPSAFGMAKARINMIGEINQIVSKQRSVTTARL